MESITWLALTGMVIWAGIGFYLAFLASQQRKLSMRLKKLELTRND